MTPYIEDQYCLIFTERSSGRTFKGKRVTPSDYALIDPDTGAKILLSQARLRKLFSCDKDNKKRKGELIKKAWARVRLSNKRGSLAS